MQRDGGVITLMPELEVQVGVRIEDIVNHLNDWGVVSTNGSAQDPGDEAWIAFDHVSDIERVMQMARQREVDCNGSVEGDTLFSYLMREASITLQFLDDGVLHADETDTGAMEHVVVVRFPKTDVAKFCALLFDTFPRADARGSSARVTGEQLH